MSLQNLEWIRLPVEGRAFRDDDGPKEISNEVSKVQGVAVADLDRAVYAIRLHSDFVIDYPKKTSPLLYIGEGSVVSRIKSHHRNWLCDFAAEQKDFAYTIWFCIPRVRNNSEAYRSVEAHLINRFQGLYGAIPLYNQQTETEVSTYQYSPQFYEVFGVGRGRKPKWALKPCPSHPSYEKYFKGFEE